MILSNWLCKSTHKNSNIDIILNLSIKALLGTRIKISKNTEILMVEFDENIRSKFEWKVSIE